jgi:hypothetical protein
MSLPEIEVSELQQQRATVFKSLFDTVVSSLTPPELRFKGRFARRYGHLADRLNDLERQIAEQIYTLQAQKRLRDAFALVIATHQGHEQITPSDKIHAYCMALDVWENYSSGNEIPGGYQITGINLLDIIFPSEDRRNIVLPQVIFP